MLDVPDDACCKKCGYSLVGLEVPRCPECGSEFDPRNSRSYLRSKRWLGSAKPPSLPGVAVTAALFLGLLTARSGQVFELVCACAGLVAFVACVPALYIEYIYRAYATWRSRQHLERRFNILRPRWIALPLCTLLGLSTFLFNWPLYMRAYASRAALEQEARRLVAAGPPPSQPYKCGLPYRQWVGLYYVLEVRIEGNSAEFYLNTSFAGSWGFGITPGSSSVADPALPPGWYFTACGWS